MLRSQCCESGGYDALQGPVIHVGPLGDTREITIDDSVVPARENIWQALYHLRYASTDRRLWVYAVCIDQGNDDERNWQVAQMSRVYSTASEALVWLGKRAADGLGKPKVNTEFRKVPECKPINLSADWPAFEEFSRKRILLYDNECWTRV